MDRYLAVLDAVIKYANKGNILEVGCGEGILQSRMNPESYARYTGIDFSKVAINKAAHLCNANTAYTYADMEVYEPKELFDVIVFNEAIYYAKNPVALLRRYAHFLKPDGHLILSIYEGGETKELLRSLGVFQQKKEAVSKNERAVWHCQVYSQQAILATRGEATVPADGVATAR